jgi:predicted  nucleic acid-binding Zn-ribbon protein
MDATKTQQPTFDEQGIRERLAKYASPDETYIPVIATRQGICEDLTAALAELSRVRAELNHEVYLVDKRKEEHRREKDALESALAEARHTIATLKAEAILNGVAGGAGEGGGRDHD